jgi:hypothetical protein
MELKMQPTIHLQRKAGYGRGKHPALPSKCIVGCIFNSVGLIITCESLCMDVPAQTKVCSVRFFGKFVLSINRRRTFFCFVLILIVDSVYLQLTHYL